MVLSLIFLLRVSLCLLNPTTQEFYQKASLRMRLADWPSRQGPQGVEANAQSERFLQHVARVHHVAKRFPPGSVFPARTVLLLPPSLYEQRIASWVHRCSHPCKRKDRNQHLDAIRPSNCFPRPIPPNPLAALFVSVGLDERSAATLFPRLGSGPTI
jgi:hypothetical protein